MAFPRQTQQAFLEGMAAAFQYFNGVFHVLRFDNLSAAVRRVLRGRKRLETDLFVAFRSHYLFTAEFCQPGPDGGHEKGDASYCSSSVRCGRGWPLPQASSGACTCSERQLRDLRRGTGACRCRQHR